MNTVVGNALYIAPLGAPAPISKMEISGERDGMEWKIVGNVANIQIEREPEFEDILYDTLRFKTSETITLSAQFVGDPENLRILWGGELPVAEERGVEAVKRLIYG